MKKSKKIITLITIFIILLIPTNQSYALGEIMSDADSFISMGEAGTNTLEMSSVQNMSNNILSVLIPVGVIVAILIAAYLGIKFMTGSVAEQAKVKETLIPYVVGCVVIFGAFTIWQLVINVFGTAF